MMSGSGEKAVVFAYESSVHSINVLLGLNEQRKQGLLCDVAIQVEEQTFRAHRSVLAACSDYFLSRTVNQQNAELITLPEQVTMKGFGPILEFAYTAKLLLNKDNVSEVHQCAELLGIHNIDPSCFQFLKFRFKGNKTVQQDFPRNKCCKSLCKKVGLEISLDHNSLHVNREGEVLENELIQVPCSKLRKCQEKNETSMVSQASPEQSSGNVCFDRENIAFICPTYDKFQQTLKENCIQSSPYMPVDQCTSTESVHQNVQGDGNNLPLASKCEECPVKVEVNKVEHKPECKERDVYQGVECSIENEDDSSFSSRSSVDPHGFLSVPFCAFEQYDGVNENGLQSNMDTHPLDGSSLPSTVSEHEFIGVDHNSNYSQKSNTCTVENSSVANGRSNVEREVAEHLAKGFWSELYNTENACPPQMSPGTIKEFPDQAYQEKKSECPWLGITITDSPERTFTNLNSVNCPFISTLATEAFSNSSDLSGGEYVQDQQQGKYPYDIVGEDSETDTEGDSESCSAREQEHEVKLPFNTRRIISLSRNDFQSLLKVHKLTSEQLDFVHDIRRRSKNRVAAQRCRKRKLDCIQNLETEIEKLQYEKDSLLKERDHILSTLGDTKNNLSELCQQVCREAALSQEQIQILAKYSASECPLSFLIPEKERLELPESLAIFPSCIGFSDSLLNTDSVSEQATGNFETGKCEVACGTMQEFSPLNGTNSGNAGPVQHSVPSGITDFCRQMTDKCTTDE